MIVKTKVEQLLMQGQQYRDSDKKLLVAYWWQQGLQLTHEQIETFMKCTPAESITRARRELKVKYPASKAVDDARFERYKDFKNAKAVSWINE